MKCTKKLMLIYYPDKILEIKPLVGFLQHAIIEQFWQNVHVIFRCILCEQHSNSQQHAVTILQNVWTV